MLFFLMYTLTSSLNAAQASPSPLSSQIQKQTPVLIRNSLKSRLGYQLVEELTTKVGPRKAGTPAEKKARQWAVQKMKSLGFKNVRIEPFPVTHWKRLQESAEILKPFPQKLHVTTLGGSVSTRQKKNNFVQGQVVRFASLDDLKEAPLKGFKGKIIFVDEWMTRTQDGSGYRTAVKKRSGAAEEAGKRKAVAALIRSVGTDHHRFPHTGQMYYKDKLPKVPIAALSAPDADQLNRALKLGSVSLKLSLQVQSKGQSTSGNVIGEIPGKTSEIVLIGAHLDSWDLGTGAVDDGAGVGITMAAAKMILNLKRKPLRTIRVVLFGSEEVGTVGAKAYAKNHAQTLHQHFVATESDFGAEKIWRFDTRFDKTQLHLAKALQRKLQPLGILPGNNTAYGGPDITPLREKGVPVVTLKQNGWDYFDLHHTANDTFDKIKPESLAQNIAAYSAFTWMAANIKGSFRKASKKKP